VDLVNGFKHGFRIPSSISSNPDKGNYTNHASALRNADKVSIKIKKELKLGRISGPYPSPPLSDMIISPLGMVPKKNSTECRLIHDLSFPQTSSVNGNIAKEFTSVSYETLDTCVELILNLGPGALVAKCDLKDAFRIIPIHPADYRLLGFRWEDNYFFDKCLPMGCSVSCQIFESFSQSLQWILKTKLDVQHMSHILDDFIFFGPKDSSVCKRGLDTFMILANSLNLPLKHEKTVTPATNVELHGILVNTVKMQLELPLDKLDSAKQKILALSNRKKARLDEVQSIIGILNFACRAIVPGRAFLRRLIDLTKNVHCKSHWIRITREARKDLHAWLVFLDSFNGAVMCLPSVWVTADTLALYTDASGFACAGVFENKWFMVEFPPTWTDTNIAIKELLPIMVSIKLWARQLANKRVLFYSDNEAVVAVLNKTSSKDVLMMSLIRDIVTVGLVNNIVFHARHIPGVNNCVADALSRLQVTKARQLVPQLARYPSPIPSEWLPWQQ
jgi:hypothetical protein